MVVPMQQRRQKLSQGDKNCGVAEGQIRKKIQARTKIIKAGGRKVETANILMENERRKSRL